MIENLLTSPLVCLFVTLLAYQFAVWMNQRCNGSPLANPVLIAVIMLITLLLVTGIPYRIYFNGAQFIHFLLGPATVALAIPLYAQFERLKKMAVPLLLALLAGSLTAIMSSILIGRLFGASLATILSLAPKSATTPIAMAIAEHIGGLPSLTSALVIMTGILGAISAQGIYRLVNCKNPVARGFALGLTSHGIGTARAFQMGDQEGAFSALAMGLNGLLTAILMPWLVQIISWLR